MSVSHVRDKAIAERRRTHPPARTRAARRGSSAPPARRRPDAMAGTARSRSASGMTITGEFEPSSMQSFLMPAVLVIRRPVSTPPVNVTSRTRGSATRASPSSSPRPVTTLSLPGGRPASIEVVRKAQRRERRGCAGLQHHRVAGGQRRAGLVAGHRQRIVERRDGADDADREAEVVADPVLGPDPAVEGQRLAREPPALLGREAQQCDASGRLAARFPDRLAAFEGDGPGVALEVRLEPRGGAHQHVIARVGGPRVPGRAARPRARHR